MSIRLFLLNDRAQKNVFGRPGKLHRKVRAIITQQICPNIGSSISEGLLEEDYPWCFVISGAALSQRHYCAGAFSLMTGEHGEKLLIVIYSMVSYSWLQKNLRSEYPLTFWAARVLNIKRKYDVVGGNQGILWQWFKALRWAYSPWRQFVLKPLWRFEHKSQMLLREGSQQDYRIRNSDGVEVMPWKNWPGCIQQEPEIWVWRQSRHRRILDSQRILLRRAEANPPDASC